MSTTLSNLNWITRYEGWAVRAAVIGVLAIPLAIFWAISLRRVSRHPAPLSISQGLLRATPPIYIVGILLLFVNAILNIVYLKRLRGWGIVDEARMYVSFIGGILTSTAGIFLTVSLVLSSLAALYLAIGSGSGGKKPFWKVLRVAIPVVALVPFALNLYIFIQGILDLNYFYKTGRPRDRYAGIVSVPQRIYLVQTVFLELLTIVALGVSIAAMLRLRKAGGVLVSNKLPALLVSASVLWLLRNTYLLAVELKSTVPKLYWTNYDALVAQNIVNPFLDLWVATIVLALLTLASRSFPLSNNDENIVHTRPRQEEKYYAQQQGFQQHLQQYLHQQKPQQQPYHQGQQKQQQQFYPTQHAQGYPHPQQQPQYNGQQYPHQQVPVQHEPSHDLALGTGGLGHSPVVR
ncbi:hypothetical protein B0H63DRAFT_462634 [Podospora didyma]|uniref:Uncharacterized protein n=1 Tax=Podospora didyma TaxID=330526 RepID=A0AAE0U946_9PEZI|nr:hypothetical protein B0H63DRAFT_462634 [Podospora didyma]